MRKKAKLWLLAVCAVTVVVALEGSATALAQSPSATAAPGGSGPALATPGAPGNVAALSISLQPFATLPGPATFIGSAFDGSGDLYGLEQAGRIWQISAGGTVGKTAWLDITDRVLAGGERGLLGVAFHPGFPADPHVYVDYTRKDDGATVVSEFSVNDGLADPASERQLLVIAQPFPNHNGGMLAFGPDGDLYIAMGDGGSADDPFGNGQNTHQLLAKLLRIDVDGAQPYAIPQDNPSMRGMDVSAEIWDWGLRNPWRFSFDQRTGWLWIGDVGQDQTEEVDLEAPGRGGLNYGWNVMEGGHCFAPPSGCDQTSLTLPILTYDHQDSRCAVIGGYVDHSETWSGLDGVYFYGDYCSGEIWGLDANGAESGSVGDPVVMGTLNGSITAFGQDESGDVYVLGADGAIFHLVGGPTG